MARENFLFNYTIPASNTWLDMEKEIACVATFSGRHVGGKPVVYTNPIMSMLETSDLINVREWSRVFAEIHEIGINHFTVSTEIVNPEAALSESLQ